MDDRTLEDVEYGYRRIMDLYYTPIEETEKDTLTRDLMRDYKRYSQFAKVSNVRGDQSQRELQDLIKKQDWQNISRLIDKLITQIESGRMNKLVIQLIIASLPEDDKINGDIFLKDVLVPLNEYLRDAKIYFDIQRKPDALIRLQRCKEILELASVIKKLTHDHGLKPLKSHQVVKVDELRGRPIYKVKE